MEGMGDTMRRLQGQILRKLETGELPVRNKESENSAAKTPQPSSELPEPQPSTESLTEKQLHRRAVIMMKVVQQYIFDKKLDTLPDKVLRATVASYDQLFTHAGIPTERIGEVYLEAMTHHGPYLLKVDDYLRAWERIRPKEYAGVDTRPMGGRGANCSICKGTGRTSVYLPKEDIEVEKECPYHCDFSTALTMRPD
jgi:hypothetical protein